MGQICDAGGRKPDKIDVGKSKNKEVFSVQLNKIEITIKNGEIFSETSIEAIIHASNDVNKNPCTKLMQFAGNKIKEKLEEAQKNNELKLGEIFLTNGGNLNHVKYIFHVTVPN